MKAVTTEKIIFHLYSKHLAGRFLQVPEHVSESFSLATLRRFFLGNLISALKYAERIINNVILWLSSSQPESFSTCIPKSY